jgi:hypothetical protein
MTSKEFLEVMKQASNFPKGMDKLIIKYGEMLLSERTGKSRELIELQKNFLQHMYPDIEYCQGCQDFTSKIKQLESEIE